MPGRPGQLVIGGREAGEALVDDPRVPLVSATGSTRMGREVGPRVAARFGRSILELGGNNAMILAPSADLDLAVRGILFSAVGTAGQRCTTLRRLIVHRSIKDEVVARVKAAYAKVRIGDPRKDNLVGPLIDKLSFDAMQGALAKARDEGGQVFGGERQLAEQYPNAYYVSPAIAEMPAQSDVVRHETFAPILYVLAYDDFEEALRLNNEVPQGLSSCIFTTDIARPSASRVPRAATAASPTSTSAPAAPRSAARSVARRKPAVAVSPAPMPGKATCVARPTP
jgi:aldehyde dehydrogenase (NAD+)